MPDALGNARLGFVVMSKPVVRVGVAAAAILLLTAIGSAYLPIGSPPEPSTTPVPTSMAASTSIESQEGSVSADPSIKGWPGTRENPAGLYSWGTSPDADPGSRDGWMHNGYQDNREGQGVEITFADARFLNFDDGPTAVTIAGREGTYQERVVGGYLTHLWIVDIDGRRMTFAVDAEPNTTPAQLVEAHAVIESIRYQQAGTGFRLVFWLPYGWDSG